MDTSQTNGHDPASRFVEELITLAGAKPTDRIIVAGCEHIEVLIALARCGFVEATCRTAVSGPSAGEASADLIIAPTVHSEAELLAILSRLSRGSRAGGALLFGTAGSPSAAWQKRRPKLLARHGFVFVREHNGSAAPRILCCRKLPKWQARAA